MSYIYEELYRHPTCVCLNLTDSCNLACKYCFVQQKPHFMTLDIAKKAVDWVIDNMQYRTEEKADITFFGGEPMLMYNDIIVPIVDYIENKYLNKINLSITTNGTLLDKEKIDFLYNHNIYPLLSIDGDKETQNFNRPQRNGEGSFDLIEKNIDYLLKKFPMITFRSTLYQPTVKNTYNNYKYAEKKGFKNIFLCPNAREEWTEQHIKELNSEINKIFTDRVLQYMAGNYPINCTLIDDIYRSILAHDLQIFYNDYEQLETERRIFRCGLGTTSASVAYNGNIFACQEQDSRDTGDYFYIGNIFNGIEIEKHKKILNDYNKKTVLISSNKELCENCPARLTCINDICPSTSHDMFSEFFIKPEIDCVFHRALFENALSSMKILVDEAQNKNFKFYLDEIFNNYKKEKRCDI